MRSAARAMGFAFSDGGRTLALAVLVGALPYGGWAATIVALCFAIPVIRASSRPDPEGSVLPAPVLGDAEGRRELLTGAGLHIVYTAPYLGVLLTGLVVQDLPELDWLVPLTFFPLVFQLILLIAWPAAVALLALEGSPLPAFSRARLGVMIDRLGMPYGGLIAWVVFGGIVVFFGANELRAHGLWGRALATLWVAWFWITGLHLVGRTLRGRGLAHGV